MIACGGGPHSCIYSSLSSALASGTTCQQNRVFIAHLLHELGHLLEIITFLIENPHKLQYYSGRRYQKRLVSLLQWLVIAFSDAGSEPS
jgi:hypothetical protein